MKPALMLIAGLVAFGVAGCGDQGSAPAPAGDPEVAGHIENATTAAPAAEADTPVARDCPARPAGATGSDGPAADVVGIRLGMGFDDVMWILTCRDDVPGVETAETWNIKQAYGIPVRQLIRASDGQPCSGQEIVRDMSSTRQTCDDGGYKFKALKNISNEIVVVFTGLPEQESAGAVWRRAVFPEDGQPAIDSLQRSLEEKYGEPQLRETDRQGRATLTWVYDLLGRPMSRAAPSFGTCSRGFNAGFRDGHSWSSGCGLTIRARIAPVYGNDLLARELHLGVMHQKNFYEAGEQFERDLLAAHETAKREQAEAAAASGSPVEL